MRRFLANGGLSGQVKTPWRFYPTTLRLPMWTRPLTLPRALRTFRVSEPRVRVISREFVKERGLVRSLYMPEFRPTLNPAEILDGLRAEVAPDGVEVVEWMIRAAAENAVLSARAEEYNRLGSELAFAANDGYIPGVIVEDCRIRKEMGRTVRTRGYAIAETPRGTFNIPDGRKATGIFRDLITWSSFFMRTGYLQQYNTLLKWRSLAETPIRQTVGFYRDQLGHSAPNFFVQRPTRPALTIRVRQRFSTDEDQTLTINFRDPTNYTRVVGSRSVDIARGENEVTYTVSAFPYVPPVVAEIQPEDNTQTKLEEYVVA